MSFAPIVDLPEKVLDRICDGRCIYPNVAVMTYHFAVTHQDFGLSGTAPPVHELLDRLHDGSIAPHEIMAFAEDHLMVGNPSDSHTRSMFDYAVEMDRLIAGRFGELDPERRRQFVRMAFAMSEQKIHRPEYLAAHFLDQDTAGK